MSGIIKINGFDWTLAPGPLHVTGVQHSGSMPGGHGSASFTVPVGSAYLAPHHSLREGEWLEIYDDAAHQQYEGEIFSVKPQVDSSGNHSLSVVCGGLISVAGKRADVSATWVHRGPEGWVRRPGTPSNLGNVVLDNGAVELRVSAASTQSFSASTMAETLGVLFYLDSGIGDDVITHFDIAGVYDVAAESTFNWTWKVYESPTIANASWSATALTATGSTSGGFADHLTPTAGTKALLLQLYCASGAHAVAADKYVTLTTFDIFSRTVPDPAVARASWAARTSKPRIDEAMVDIATRPGLADTFYSLPLGPPQDDLRVGNDKAKVTAAGALSTLASRFAQPFEYAFWDKRHFICQPTPTIPSDAHVIVVGAGQPGLESWDVAEYDEDVPDAVLVLYGNKDDATLPESHPRRVYRPATPADTADVKVETIDFSQYILSDKDARAIGDNAVATSQAAIPAGNIFDAHPAKAKLGVLPGNNLDPTAQFQDMSDNPLFGTLSGMAYTTASGWGGSGSLTDPYHVQGDGIDAYISWGDVALCNFGLGAFSVRDWFKLTTLGVINPLMSKIAAGTTRRGWEVYVSAANKLVACVSADFGAGSYLQKTGGTTLAAGVWYHVTMAYAGSGGALALYLNGIAESLTTAGAPGAYDLSNTGSLKMMAG